MGRREVICWWFVVVFMAVMAAEGKAPELHRVGGTRGWAPNVNYTEWATNQTFYVGDWLSPLYYFLTDFGFDKHVYNVLEVNKTSYELCKDKGFIKNITRGGRDVYNLTEAKQFYFLSSGGYCFQGMKLNVDVVEFDPSLELAPSTNGSPVDTVGRIKLAIFLHLLCFGLVFVVFS